MLYQPALKFDYQATQGIRVSFKYQGNNNAKRVSIGSLPGWNDSITPIPEKGTEAVTVNWNINSTTFLEATYGRAGNQLAGCGGLPVNTVADARTTGLANLPLMFPDANVINPSLRLEILQFNNRRFRTDPHLQDSRLLVGQPNRVRKRRLCRRRCIPRLPRISRPGHRHQRDEIVGQHIQSGFYNNNSLKRENNVLSGTNFRTINFTQDAAGINPSTLVSASRTPRSGRSVPSCRPPSTSRGPSHTTIAKATYRTTGR
jgi:hypothetical protein